MRMSKFIGHSFHLVLRTASGHPMHFALTNYYELRYKFGECVVSYVSLHLKSKYIPAGWVTPGDLCPGLI